MRELMSLALMDKRARDHQALEKIALAQETFTPWLPDASTEQE